MSDELRWQSFFPILKGAVRLNDYKRTNTREPKKQNTRRDTSTTMSSIADTADETEARSKHAQGAHG